MITAETLNDHQGSESSPENTLQAFLAYLRTSTHLSEETLAEIQQASQSFLTHSVEIDTPDTDIQSVETVVQTEREVTPPISVKRKGVGAYGKTPDDIPTNGIPDWTINIWKGAKLSPALATMSEREYFDAPEPFDYQKLKPIRYDATIFYPPNVSQPSYIGVRLITEDPLQPHLVGCSLFHFEPKNESELFPDDEVASRRRYLQTRLDHLDLTLASYVDLFKRGYNPFMFAATSDVPTRRQAAPEGDIQVYAQAEPENGIPPQHIWERFQGGKLDNVLGLIEYLRRNRVDFASAQKHGVRFDKYPPTILVNKVPWPESWNMPIGLPQSNGTRSFDALDLATILGSYNFFAAHAPDFGFEMPIITSFATGPFKTWSHNLCFIDTTVNFPRNNYTGDWTPYNDAENTQKYLDIMDQMGIEYQKGK